MKKTFIEWVAYIILYIWQLPQNILALLYWLRITIEKDKVVVGETKWSRAYSAKTMSGGISLGMYCFLSPTLAKRQESVAHELLGHTVQSRILGPLYLIIIGLPSLLNAAFGFTKCYYSFYTEAWANFCAGLEADEDCRLRFKEQKTTS